MAKTEITDQNFEEMVMKSDKPVLVDFWATWCGPCRVQGPIVEELASEVGDKYVVGAMDVDQNPMHAQQFSILSIPTLMIFKGGKMVWRVSGVTGKEALLEQLEKAAA